MSTRPPLPPFNEASAREKVKLAQRLWNIRDSQKVAKAYTADTIWRNRDSFLKGTDKVVVFLTKKWEKEKEYKLRKELFAFTDNKIAVQFWYEFYDEAQKKWFRCYGLEDWTFNPDGLMWKRQMGGNNIEIEDSERWFKDKVTDEEYDAVSIGPQHW